MLNWRGMREAALGGKSGGSGGMPVIGSGTNLPFDDRIEFSSSPWVPRLVRGWGQNYNTATKKLGGAKFYFLFNPNQVNVTYGINPGARAGGNQDMAAALEGGGGGPSSISYSFGLMFDRTYEVAYNGDKEGVFRDVEALECVLGISQSMPYLTSGHVVRWVLGTDLVVYGAVQSLGVEYAYFNHDMIPMRCTMALSVLHIPIPGDLTENLGKGGSATGGAAAPAAKPAYKGMTKAPRRTTTRRSGQRGRVMWQ